MITLDCLAKRQPIGSAVCSGALWDASGFCEPLRAAPFFGFHARRHGAAMCWRLCASRYSKPTMNVVNFGVNWLFEGH
jgi:hypothetical protein